MRNFIFSSSILFLVALTIFSCGKNGRFSTKGADSISFDSIKVDTTVFLNEDTSGPRCQVALCITYAKGKKSDYINDTIIRSGILSPDYFSITPQKIKIEEAVKSFVSRYVNEYKKDYGDLYKADKTNAAAYNCEYFVKTNVTQENNDYFNYVADVYMYGGGAHGMSVTIIKNIDANTGKIISLKDIFVPGYEQKLNEVIVKKLCEQFDAKNLNELNEKTIFMNMDVYPSENFIIGKKNITFVYSTDEIACHATGEIRVEIENSELEDLLKKR